jgi:hypothetical protein
MMERLLPLVVVLLLVGACAQSTAPTGGPVPEVPPAVISVTPDTFEVRSPFGGPVRIEFERRLSERPTGGSLRDAVIVSPRTGTVDVSVTRTGLSIDMEGGFREETIYRITLLPRFQDRFQNRFQETLDFYFSTGPDFEPNVLAGILVDRLTLQEVPEARVDARQLPDGPTHSTVSDSTGVFAFSYLPSGRYSLTAYEDLNRNREPDFAEPQDAIDVELVRGDTLILTDLALLAPDTTAAVVTGATALDSISVEVTFDDHLDPAESLDDVVARLEREEGGEVPEVVEILHRWEWDRREEARMREEAADPAEEDPDADDPDDPDVDDPEVDAVDLDAPPGIQAELDDPILPDQAIVLLLSGALEPGEVYRVELSQIRNLHGIPGGGGDAEFEGPEPEPEEEPGEEPDDDDPPDGDNPPDGDIPSAGDLPLPGDRS